MTPEPSKRSFTHPLAADALAWFCHPRNEVFRQPVRHPDGAVYAANGYLALRVSRGPLTFGEFQAASADFLARIDKLPWARLALDPARTVTPVWRALDEVRGLIYQGEPLPLWPGGHMTGDKAVWTGGSMRVPLAMLQLLARLPRCEMMLGGSDFLPFRFSGGEGLLADRWRHARPADVPPHVLSIFHPRPAGLPGGLV